MSYENDLKKVMILYPGLNISCREDFRHLINIHNVAESILGDKLDTKIVVASFNNRGSVAKLSSENDYSYLLFKTASKIRGLKKTAYPTIDNRDIAEEYNIDKWADLVYKIYTDVENKKADLETTIQHYSKDLDPKTDEPENFRRWLHYYNDGESVKYSKKERRSRLSELTKQADFNLNSPAKPSNYSDNASGITLTGITPVDIKNYVKDKKQEQDSSKDGLANFRKRINRAIRSIDNLLRSRGHDYFNSQTLVTLFDYLHDFSKESMGLKNEVTAIDLTYQYANKFKKLGFDEGYRELVKNAQQAGETESVDDVPAPAEVAAAPTATPAETVSTEAAPAAAQPEVNKNAPAAKEELTTPLERALAPVTESKKEEYKSLAGDVGLADAVEKLEDIAGRLSDRRTIRLLAEFDIILDKIGIAPMFPELAEAQSKLIDSYSYALVRVTKMLGMLSSGKSILEISESKRNELVGKTLKEVNRGIEQGEATAQALEAARNEGAATEAEAEAPPAEAPVKKGPAATQEGLEQAGLTQPAEPSKE